MSNTIRKTAVLLLAFAVIVLVGCSLGAGRGRHTQETKKDVSTNPAAMQSDPIALLYSGPVADKDGVEALKKAALNHHLKPVEFQSFHNLPGLLENASVLIVGGTEDDLSPITNSITDEVEKALMDFVTRGGRYLGICGGAYLGSQGWDESFGFVKGFGLIGVTTVAYREDPDPAVISLLWKGKKRPIYYQYGPKFIPDQEDGQLHPVAIYHNKEIAAVWAHVGKGRVYLCGPHPEADESWLIDYDGTMIQNANAWNETKDLANDVFADLLMK